MTSAAYRPQVEVDEKMWGGRLNWYRDWITHPGSRDPYWAEGHWETLHNVPSRLKIPVFVGEGWYDHHLGSMLQGYGNLSAEAMAHSVFQINPGNHGLRPVIHGQPKQDHAAIDEITQQIRWFRDILVEEKTPAAAVQYYVIGADEWRNYADYPPKTENEAVFFLNNGTLDKAPGAACSRSYVYDPQNPVITYGAESLFASWKNTGSLEQPEPNWRSDVISFVSEPLEKPLDVVGAIKAKLWVKSDAPDTCFTVKVMEVFPDGKAWHIRNGITTLGWRNGAVERQSYNGEPVEITIACWDIAWQLQPGSRLRVDISSSNFPEFSVHPNTDVLWSEATETKTANQTVLMGEEYPSRLILPLDKVF
jgi:putative CocE/NonD family hydrolase